MDFSNLNIEGLLQGAEQLQLRDDNSYLDSYDCFISYFKDIDEIERKHLIIGSHFVYGWMPRVLHLRLEDKEVNVEKVLKILNYVKTQNCTLDQEDLKVLMACINNSLVGVSKLLHFINPQYYAIWDSKIQMYISGKNKSQYQVSKPKNYLDYLKCLKEIIGKDKFKQVREKVLAKHEPAASWSDMRIAELVMFNTA